MAVETSLDRLGREEAVAFVTCRGDGSADRSTANLTDVRAARAAHAASEAEPVRGTERCVTQTIARRRRARRVRRHRMHDRTRRPRTGFDPRVLAWLARRRSPGLGRADADVASVDVAADETRTTSPVSKSFGDPA